MDALHGVMEVAALVFEGWFPLVLLALVIIAIIIS